MSKILQKEGKTSDTELKSAIKDFGKLEKQHKTSAKVRNPTVSLEIFR